ncbi:MAG: hypothetical protein WBB65_08150, partial [Anaerolineales bacterium]
AGFDCRNRKQIGKLKEGAYHQKSGMQGNCRKETYFSVSEIVHILPIYKEGLPISENGRPWFNCICTIQVFMPELFDFL